MFFSSKVLKDIVSCFGASWVSGRIPAFSNVFPVFQPLTFYNVLLSVVFKEWSIVGVKESQALQILFSKSEFTVIKKPLYR